MLIQSSNQSNFPLTAPLNDHISKFQNSTRKKKMAMKYNVAWNFQQNYFPNIFFNGLFLEVTIIYASSSMNITFSFVGDWIFLVFLVGEFFILIFHVGSDLDWKGILFWMVGLKFRVFWVSNEGYDIWEFPRFTISQFLLKLRKNW
jgi:hypothetical protein